MLCHLIHFCAPNFGALFKALPYGAVFTSLTFDAPVFSALPFDASFNAPPFDIILFKALAFNAYQ